MYTKDLELVDATLDNGDCVTCATNLQDITRTLQLGINNTTGSDRTSFAFWGTLKEYDGITGLEGSQVQHQVVCLPPWSKYSW
jgi:hypothetical protein